MRPSGRAWRPGVRLCTGVLVLTSLACASHYVDIFCELERGMQKGAPFEVAAFEVPAPRAQAHLSAGVASTDITPPPGFPTGGHSAEGALPRGHWMRLRARAFFFEDAQGHALALVSCDLFAIPGGLHAKVAQLVAAEAARRGLQVALPPEALVVAATHTHHGPANFLTARVYNQFASSYSGFSRPLLDFLARRIADAVVGAVADARDSHGPALLHVHAHRVGYTLVRNREPHTFMVNRDRDALLDALNGAERPPCRPEEGEPDAGWELSGCPRLRATRRDLTVVDVLRERGGRRERIGALVFFAVHPTVLHPGAPLYTPDLVGHAMQGLERQLAVDGREPVVGFFNGAEGDITARRQRRDLVETARLGDLLADEVTCALAADPVLVLPGGAEGGTPLQPTLAVRTVQLRPRVEADACCEEQDGGTLTLARAPTFGTAALGGGEDDHTALHALGWRRGVVDRPLDGQGVKFPGLDAKLVRAVRMSAALAPPDTFPDTLPLTVATLGPLALATVPLELTTAQGEAIRAALARPGQTLEIIGLANEYLSYCSSRDEYSVQDYMGASTLWGPSEGDFIRCRLERLHEALTRAPQAPGPVEATRVPKRTFRPGATARPPFGITFAGDVVSRPDEGLHEVLMDARERLPARDLPWFSWVEPLDCAPGKKACCVEDRPLCGAQARHIVLWHRPQGGGWRAFRSGQPREGLEDDRGASVLTVYLGTPAGSEQARWAALWLRPLWKERLEGAQREDDFMFVVQPASVAAPGPVVCSEPFRATPPRRGGEMEEAACPPGVGPAAPATPPVVGTDRGGA